MSAQHADAEVLQGCGLRQIVLEPRDMMPGLQRAQEIRHGGGGHVAIAGEAGYEVGQDVHVTAAQGSHLRLHYPRAPPRRRLRIENTERQADRGLAEQTHHLFVGFTGTFERRVQHSAQRSTPEDFSRQMRATLSTGSQQEFHHIRSAHIDGSKDSLQGHPGTGLDEDPSSVYPLVLDGVLQGDVVTLLTARVVHVRPSGSKHGHGGARVGVLDLTEVCQVERCAAITAVGQVRVGARLQQDPYTAVKPQPRGAVH